MIEEKSKVKNITIKYTIKNNGPSHVNQMKATILIPTIFFFNSNYTLDLVNSSSVFIRNTLLNNIKIEEISDPDSEKNEIVDYSMMHINNTVSQSVTSLLPNRTLFMDCSNPQEDHFKCDEFSFMVNGLKNNGHLFEFTVEFSLNMSQFGKMIKI